MNERPIFATFLSISSKINSNDWLNQLNLIREVLTYQNPCLTDPGEMEPIDLLKFILESMHKESRSKNNTNNIIPYFCSSININYSNTFNEYTSKFVNYQSFISDCFFGTYEITRFCVNCKNKTFYFRNFLFITFNIDESIKNGLNGIDISYYFI
jgi:hypothetical protein